MWQSTISVKLLIEHLHANSRKFANHPSGKLDIGCTALVSTSLRATRATSCGRREQSRLENGHSRLPGRSRLAYARLSGCLRLPECLPERWDAHGPTCALWSQH